VLLLDECRRGRIGRIRAALRSFKRSLTGRSARQQKLA
jgi:hypothetical protein